MTLHHEAIELLRELLRELDAIPATRLLLKANPKGEDYYKRGRAIVARADDLRLIGDKRRLRDAVAELAKRYKGKGEVEHAVLESLVNARSACAQVGDGDSVAPLETAALIVEQWFAQNAGQPVPTLPKAPPAGGPFAGDASLFRLNGYEDPGDAGRRSR